MGIFNQRFPYSSFQYDGMVKIHPMAGVEEKVLHSLGWTNLEFLEKRRVGTYACSRGWERSETQMYYEFGIFSTVYGGEEMPNWMTHRSEDPSISFTIPSSPKKLLGLNLCCVETNRMSFSTYKLPVVKISNITKNHTWIYQHYISPSDLVSVDGKCLIYLSHWMFGVNEMESGDQVTITVIQGIFPRYRQETSKCGVSVVYDDGNMEEVDALDYYKSWNHIIGGDLSAFQTTSGEYFLNHNRFMWYNHEKDSTFDPFEDDKASYKEKQVAFKAFSQRKSDILESASQVYHDNQVVEERKMDCQ